MRSARPAPPAACFTCAGVGKSYAATVGGRPWRHVVLRDLSLVVRAGCLTAIAGMGPGPVTVLRCMAGLVAPERGRVSWRDQHGQRTSAPPRALVDARWRPYACFTVRDVLEHAVPRGLTQPDADRLVCDAAARCSLGDDLGRRVTSLAPPAARLLAVAAALAGGARWLLLDRRDASDAGARPADPRPEGGSGPALAPAPEGAARTERSVLRSLVASGITVVVAGPAGRCGPLAPSAVIALDGGWLEAGPEAVPGHRVAEGEPDSVPPRLGARPLPPSPALPSFGGAVIPP